MWPAPRLALGTASALGLARFAYGLLLPAMRDDLSWTLAAAGAMSAANWLRLSARRAADRGLVRRLGATTAFRVAMALTARRWLVTAVSGDYLALVVLRTLSGAAGAVVFVVGGVIASRLAAAADSPPPSPCTSPARGWASWSAAWPYPCSVSTGGWPGWPGRRCRAGDGGQLDRRQQRTGGPVTGRARLRPLRAPALAYLLFAAGYITYITFLSAYLADQAPPSGRWSSPGPCSARRSRRHPRCGVVRSPDGPATEPWPPCSPL